MTSRQINPLLLAFSMLALLLVGGTAGYMLIEGWDAWDAFYMSAISLTTVGYKEVHPLSRAGEVFTVFLLFTGVGLFFYAFALVGARVVEGGLQHRWERRRMDRMIEDLRDHFIVCGYGRIGSIVVDDFMRQSAPCVVIDRDAQRLEAARARGALTLEGDASSEELLTKAAVQRARGLIASLSTDAENVYTILSARLLGPSLYIIGRAESEESATKLRRAGADRVISPYQIGGQHMAQLALRPAVVEFVQLVTSSEFMDLSMEQIEVRAGGPLTGRSIVGANLRQRFGVIVVGIRRRDGRMEFNPAPDAVMSEGDHLVLLGQTERLAELGTFAGVSSTPA
ncbi:MAG: NAD-binding protein [Vicinamibacterales bacterium]